ncbi:integrase arm-type DNA-binding domain-containing protein [Mariprofundus sp. KV]|uniref:tyrosine-type recombinase/integrase n=1 Tax=Mariprofundus sp. KV TaxID=2608715 RepID=UPI0015A12903|nr:integrase arm-type DNA-binding domain-containing protein [Mariprofundus sp. KV]NWF37267.1 DUF4102 domain-containing protein [Mariprofundus sp. KV]
MIISTDMQVKAAQLPDGKTKVKFSAGAGLYLLINPSGKYWKYAYKYDGKRKEASLGVYPNTSLKAAKVKLQAIKVLLSTGIDPNQQKKELRQANIAAAIQKKETSIADSNTFEVVAYEWLDVRSAEWVDSHYRKQVGRLQRHIFPVIGSIPISQLKRDQIADVLIFISKSGSHDIARRMTQVTRNILNYACNRGLIEAVPMGDMKAVLPVPVSTKMPAITDATRIGLLLRAIHGYDGSFVVCQALKLLPLLAVRAGEFRTAEWKEFDLDAALWTIPAAHRKLPKLAKENPVNVHFVPLSKQAVVLFKELQEVTGRGKHVFPSVRGDARPMSENAINVALHAMGFDDMVGHGWRSVFSTSLNEQGFNPDAIERQLAHVERNSVRAAYNRSDYLTERTKMMQHWSDYLDSLCAGADVISIGRSHG